jgi:hypothetical protein
MTLKNWLKISDNQNFFRKAGVFCSTGLLLAKGAGSGMMDSRERFPMACAEKNMEAGRVAE